MQVNVFEYLHNQILANNIFYKIKQICINVLIKRQGDKSIYVPIAW